MNILGRISAGFRAIGRHKPPKSQDDNAKLEAAEFAREEDMASLGDSNVKYVPLSGFTPNRHLVNTVSSLTVVERFVAERILKAIEADERVLAAAHDIPCEINWVASNIVPWSQDSQPSMTVNHSAEFIGVSRFRMRTSLVDAGLLDPDTDLPTITAMLSGLACCQTITSRHYKGMRIDTARFSEACIRSLEIEPSTAVERLSEVESFSDAVRSLRQRLKEVQLQFNIEPHGKAKMRKSRILKSGFSEADIFEFADLLNWFPISENYSVISQNYSVISQNYSVLAEFFNIESAPEQETKLYNVILQEEVQKIRDVCAKFLARTESAGLPYHAEAVDKILDFIVNVDFVADREISARRYRSLMLRKRHF